MSAKDNGGPAFPLAASTGDPRDGVYATDGMNLRDYFAAAALTGLMRHPDSVGEKEETVAAWAYAAADAMIAERLK